MNKNLSVKVSIQIEALPPKVWKALTDPEIVKQYLFGTEVSSGWKTGNTITWKGEYNGKTYLDKGIIKRAIPNELLEYTYWSSMSGKEDRTENYATITVHLEPRNKDTILVLTQDNIESEQSQEHSRKNWEMVLEKMKHILEANPETAS